MEYNIIEGDCLDVLAGLPAGQFQTCITSPPYFGLRDYGVAGQIGLERTPEEYTARLVEVFRQVRRVLRDDGTLWLNLGDCYSTPKVGNTNGTGKSTLEYAGRSGVATYKTVGLRQRKPKSDLGPKQLLGIPWRGAFALQADGWILRADVIWAKSNAMPEPVKDRPTKSHEYLFLFAKKARYFYDSDAIREPFTTKPVGWLKSGPGRTCYGRDGLFRPGGPGKESSNLGGRPDPSGRNRRSVWAIPTRSYKGAHFAVFPPALVEPCVLAGTSEAGCCPRCGAAWRRVVERGEVPMTRRRKALSASQRMGHPDFEPRVRPSSLGAGSGGDVPVRDTKTLGWKPTCACEHTAGEPCVEISKNEGSSVRVNAPAPCTVLDPFCGSGTTGLVALRHGRRFVGVELNPAYIALARARLDKAAADRPLLALT